MVGLTYTLTLHQQTNTHTTACTTGWSSGASRNASRYVLFGGVVLSVDVGKRGLKLIAWVWTRGGESQADTTLPT